MSSIIAFSHSFKKRNLIAGIIAGLSFLSASNAGAGDDAVRASFQRMFDHQPASATGYRAPRDEADPVQELVNTALRSPGQGTRGAPDCGTSLSLND